MEVVIYNQGSTYVKFREPRKFDVHDMDMCNLIHGLQCLSISGRLLSSPVGLKNISRDQIATTRVHGEI